MIQFHNLKLCDLMEGLWFFFCDCRSRLMEWMISLFNEWHFKEKMTQSEGERSIPFTLISISVRSWSWIWKINSLSFSSVSSFEEDDSRRLVSPRGKNTRLIAGNSTGEELCSFSLIRSHIQSIPLPLDQSDHQTW